MIGGRIKPGEAPGTSPGFEEAMSTLDGAAYTLKFMSKLRPEDPIDYPVMAPSRCVRDESTVLQTGGVTPHPFFSMRIARYFLRGSSTRTSPLAASAKRSIVMFHVSMMSMR